MYYIRTYVYTDLKRHSTDTVRVQFTHHDGRIFRVAQKLDRTWVWDGVYSTELHVKSGNKFN